MRLLFLCLLFLVLSLSGAQAQERLIKLGLGYVIKKYRNGAITGAPNT